MNGKRIHHQAVQLLDGDRQAVLLHRDHGVGGLTGLGGGNKQALLHRIRTRRIVVQGGGADGGVDGTDALLDEIGRGLGDDLPVLHGIGAGHQVGVPLQNQVYPVCLDHVVEPGTVLATALAVVDGLMDHDDLPLGILVRLQVGDQPLTLSLQQVFVLCHVRARIQHDEVHVAVIIGIDRILRVFHLNPETGIGDLIGDTGVKGVGSVVGMVEMQGEIVVQILRPGVVVAYGGEVREGRGVLSDGLEIPVPHGHIRAPVGDVARIEHEGGVARLLHGQLHRRPTVGVAVGPGPALGIAYGDKAEATDLGRGGLEGIGLTPATAVRHPLEADLVFVLGIRSQPHQVGLEKALPTVLGVLDHLTGIDLLPLGLAFGSVLQGHTFGILDEGIPGRPGKEPRGAGVVEGGDQIVHLGGKTADHVLVLGDLVCGGGHGGVLHVSPRHSLPAGAVPAEGIPAEELVATSPQGPAIGQGDVHQQKLLGRVDGHLERIASRAKATLNLRAAHAEGIFPHREKLGITEFEG